MSRLGNNQFTKLPMRLPRVTYCEYVNTSYRKYFMSAAKPPASNLPYTDDPNIDLCASFRADHDVKTVFKMNAQ